MTQGLHDNLTVTSYGYSTQTKAKAKMPLPLVRWLSLLGHSLKPDGPVCFLATII